MIEVKLTNCPTGRPMEAISNAAKTCYEGDIPPWGETIDVKGRLWDVGHHTTFQHTSYTFSINLIAIGDITFGLHLANPFYNSSQRSGRFCAGMFSNPDIEFLKTYIGYYYPLCVEAPLINYILLGSMIYQENIMAATEMAAELIRKERPRASERYIKENAPKIAQEQLRVFLPVIFPTGLQYTLNTSALAAMYRSAWSPVLKDVTEKMAALVLENEPEIGFIFERKENNDQIVELPTAFTGISKKPLVRLISSGDASAFVKPTAEEMHPIDLLHFVPRLMNNNTQEIKSEVEFSVATMGQDQRHRTVKRGFPSFTGGFYLPPIPSMLGLEREAEKLFRYWLFLIQVGGIEKSLACTLVPYGAVVKYKKSASYNSAIHELSKRKCLCAQEEICRATCLLEDQLEDHPITEIMNPNCVLITGKCGEGKRFCGRDSLQEFRPSKRRV